VHWDISSSRTHSGLAWAKRVRHAVLPYWCAEPRNSGFEPYLEWGSEREAVETNSHTGHTVTPCGRTPDKRAANAAALGVVLGIDSLSVRVRGHDAAARCLHMDTLCWWHGSCPALSMIARKQSTGTAVWSSRFDCFMVVVRCCCWQQAVIGQGCFGW